MTGAGRGIGRGIALRLARHGADVALVDIGPDGIDARRRRDRRNRLRRQPHSSPTSATAGQVFAAVEHAATALGGFDIMVNNAGIALVGPIAEVTPRTAAKVWAINVDGVLWGIQAAVAKFKELGRARGKVINASSIAGHEGFAMLGPYSATKFAVRALTQAAAKEHAADGITVNAYCPGVVGTDMWVEIDKRFAELTGAAEGETFEKFVGGIALGRAGDARRTSPDSSPTWPGPDADYMTGQAGLIDGGMVYR